MRSFRVAVPIEWEQDDPIGDLIEALPPVVVPTLFVPEGQALATAQPGERRRILCRPEDADRIRAAIAEIYR